ncbi:PQQ-like beta-propeller repeat protein [bacterium]|nr:PQQ-like beta-propeller repeat protein [bacterium]
MPRMSDSMAPLLLTVFFTLCTAPACTNTERDASPVVKVSHRVELAGRRELYGGDQRSWLSPKGSIGDSGYCAASLRLPLAREPAWVMDYTGAEFSRFPPRRIVHRDGLLVVSAEGTQLLGLDTATGERLFNEHVYHTMERLGEKMETLFLHPAGLLFGQDEIGRHYCWDIASPEGLRGGAGRGNLISGAGRRNPNLISEVWFIDQNDSMRLEPSDFVSQGDKLFTGWDSYIRALSSVDGSTIWTYPTLQAAGGIVLGGAGGTLLWWSNRGDVMALRAEDGVLLWAATLATRIDGVILNDDLSHAYLIRYDEKLECRKLESGELLWEHDWSDLMDPAERRRRAEESGQITVLLRASKIAASREGVIISLISGDVLALDHFGARRWRYHTTTPVIDSLAFENGVMLLEFYLSIESPRPLELLLPFCLDPPEDWRNYNRANEESKKAAIFMRVAILDNKTGKLLDHFEPDRRFWAGPVPAYDKIVFGQRLPTAGHNRVLAYDWLVPEAAFSGNRWQGPVDPSITPGRSAERAAGTLQRPLPHSELEKGEV